MTKCDTNIYFSWNKVVYYKNKNPQKKQLLNELLLFSCEHASLSYIFEKASQRGELQERSQHQNYQMEKSSITSTVGRKAPKA